MPADISAIDWTIRLALAVVLSGFVGFEREARRKAAGFRTHMLVGFGAALFTLVSIDSLGGGDPARIAAQIVSGVGFLGAGAIFREGVNVRGLTTAAGLWGVAAIGMTVGAGLIEGALIATGLVLVILTVMGYFEFRLQKRHIAAETRRVEVILSDLSELTEVVNLACMLDDGARHVAVDRNRSDRFEVTFDIQPDRIPAVTAALSMFESVMDIGETDFEPDIDDR